MHFANAQGDIPTSEVEKVVKDPETNFPIKELYYVYSRDKTTRHGRYRALTLKDEIFIQGNYQNGAKQGRWKYKYAEEPYAWKKEGDYDNDAKTGKWIYYYNIAGTHIKETQVFQSDNEVVVERFSQGGRLESKGKMVLKKNDLVEDGNWVFYYSNGQKESEGEFIYSDAMGKSIKTGEWKIYSDKGVLKFIEPYNSRGQIHGVRQCYAANGEFDKNEIYNKGVLEKTEDKFLFQKNSMDSLSRLAEKYQSYFASIYNGEIAKTKQDIVDYEQSAKDNARYKKGETIVEHLKQIVDNYDVINSQDIEIKKQFKIVAAKYNTSFSTVYQSVSDIFGQELADYNKQSTISETNKKGKDLSSKVINLDTCYNFLQKVESAIKNKYLPIENYAQDSFPSIYNGEFQTFRATVEQYHQISSFTEMLAKGDEILKYILKIEIYWKDLKEWNVEMYKRQDVISRYKKEYPSIYENIKPLIDKTLNDYGNIGTLNEKLQSVKTLGNFFMRYETDYDKLENQKKEIIAKHNEFVNLYKPDKANKVVFKRGEELYDMYIEIYYRQAAANTRWNVGEKMKVMLAKLMEFSGKDNTEIIEKLKAAQNPKEYETILGLN